MTKSENRRSLPEIGFPSGIGGAGQAHPGHIVPGRTGDGIAHLTAEDHAVVFAVPADLNLIFETAIAEAK